MKKGVALLFLFWGAFCSAYVSKEPLFGQTFVFNGAYDSLMVDRCLFVGGSVALVHGSGQFVRFVLQNDKPVVLKIFRGEQGDSLFQDVAKELKDKVSFAVMDIADQENFAVVQRIMSQVGIGTIGVPFFLFFKQREMILPPLVFPPIFGFVAKERMDKLRGDFVEYIKKQFFPETEASTLDKIGRLMEKVSQWLTGFRNVSCKEVKAYHLSNKH